MVHYLSYLNLVPSPDFHPSSHTEEGVSLRLLLSYRSLLVLSSTGVSWGSRTRVDGSGSHDGLSDQDPVCLSVCSETGVSRRPYELPEPSPGPHSHSPVPLSVSVGPGGSRNRGPSRSVFVSLCTEGSPRPGRGYLPANPPSYWGRRVPGKRESGNVGPSVHRPGRVPGPPPSFSHTPPPLPPSSDRRSDVGNQRNYPHPVLSVLPGVGSSNPLSYSL